MHGVIHGAAGRILMYCAWRGYAQRGRAYLIVLYMARLCTAQSGAVQDAAGCGRAYPIVLYMARLCTAQSGTVQDAAGCGRADTSLRLRSASEISDRFQRRRKIRFHLWEFYPRGFQSCGKREEKARRRTRRRKKCKKEANLILQNFQSQCIIFK